MLGSCSDYLVLILLFLCNIFEVFGLHLHEILDKTGVGMKCIIIIKP